ncbi:ubiquitin carboxyl-terminal hydrolase 37-like [Dicentrarchus labrax]|uniref:ubiquitin carboxyl-terminal hydrolase 37-like n=1 Tax=Dicentrarchus labrax TaxID=13489 RepID=UPI0021F5320D|nr:ubiquitin carboxyl-terminal hydrolase 37-like [Dicentrarchus labrax]
MLFVTIKEDPIKDPVVPDTPATTATPFSAPTEAPKRKDKKTSWWRKWCPKKKTKQLTPEKEDVAEETNLPSSPSERSVDYNVVSEGGEAVPEASSTPDPQVSAGTELNPEEEDVAEDTNLLSSATEESVDYTAQSEGEEAVQDTSSTPDRQVSAGTELNPEEEDVAEDTNLLSSATEESVDTILGSKDGEAVQEASSTPDPQVSAGTELQPKEEEVAEDTNLRSSTTEERVDNTVESEGGEAVQEASSTPDRQVSAGNELNPEEEDMAEDTNLPSSATEESVDTILRSEDGEAVQEPSSTPDPQVSATTELNPEEEDVAEDLSSFATEESVDTILGSEDGEAVQEPSSTPDPQVSATTELNPEEDVAEDTNLLSSATEESFDNVQDSEGGLVVVQEASSTPDTPVSVVSETKKKKKRPWWRRWFWPRRKKQKSASPVETDGEERSPSSEVTTIKADIDVISDLPPAAPVSRRGRGGSQSGDSAIDLLASIQDLLPSTSNTGQISREELVCLGFPNLAQTCYMNSTLQGLLTLRPFVLEVHSQQQVWSSVPTSQLISGFVDVRVCRFSSNEREKRGVLFAFKQTVAEFNSEFKDDSQKDAHEFLSCVLDRLRSLSLHLDAAAVDMGMSYTCPVNAHIAFQMLSTRTCKGCGMQSMREEDYINLSLDLVPGGSVSEFLQEYLKQRHLDYRCECGAEESLQQSSFLTHPNVLILQLQRFRFTKSFNLEKMNSPVVLPKELVVIAESSTAKQTHYSLVSVVSHLGSTAHSGHYICDGAHRQLEPGDMTVRWLTYNDSAVSETAIDSVCHLRQRTAYLLFYERQL